MSRQFKRKTTTEAREETEPEELRDITKSSKEWETATEKMTFKQSLRYKGGKPP